jgi:hypothetical protein
MSYELVYDVATTSQAPRVALTFAAAAVALTLVWGVWLRVRGVPLTTGVKFAAGVAALLVVIAVLTFVEQRHIASRADARTIEGPVTGLWTKDERERRADGSWSTWQWEGFTVGGVAFVYARNVEQNYFHNGGPTAIALRDGMRVRLRYVDERDGDAVRHQIVRVERAID